MSMLSAWTMGAMASKNDRASSPVSSRIAWLRAGEARGPAATITLDHSAGGRPATSPRAISMREWAAMRAVTAAEKPSRSTARRAAGRHLVRVGRGHDQRAAGAHLGVQQAHGVVLGVVGAEGVGADELRQAVGLVRGGGDRRAHLVQHHARAGLGRLPRRLAARQAAADDVDGLHPPLIGRGRPPRKVRCSRAAAWAIMPSGAGWGDETMATFSIGEALGVGFGVIGAQALVGAGVGAGLPGAAASRPSP